MNDTAIRRVRADRRLSALSRRIDKCRFGEPIIALIKTYFSCIFVERSADGDFTQERVRFRSEPRRSLPALRIFLILTPF